MAMEADFLTPMEAARYVRVHRETLYDLIRSQTIKASKVGGRWRIPVDNLDSYLRIKSPRPFVHGKPSNAVQERISDWHEGLVGREQVRWKRVMVVDDSAEIREFFQIVLSKRGHTVVEAENGREAIERVKREMYDLIFIDLAMPEIDGVETLKAIRAIDPEPTIVLTTTYPDGELVTKALGMGPFVIMDKPIRVSDVLKVVES